MEPQGHQNRGSYADIARTAASNIAPWRIELAKISVFLLVDASYYEITKGIRQIEWNGAVDAIIPSGKGKWRLTFLNQELCDRFFTQYREEGILVAGIKATIVKNRALHVIHVEAENPLAPKMAIVEILKEIGEVKRMEKVKNNGFWTGIWMAWIDKKLKQRSITLRGPDYRVKVVDRHWRADHDHQDQPTAHEERNADMQQISKELSEILGTSQNASPESYQDKAEDAINPQQSTDRPTKNGEEQRQEDDNQETDRPNPPRSPRQEAEKPHGPGITRLIQQPITEAFKSPQGKKGTQDKRTRKDTSMEITVNVIEIPEVGLNRTPKSNASGHEDWMDTTDQIDLTSREKKDEHETRSADGEKGEQDSPPKKWRKTTEDEPLEMGTEKGCPQISGGPHP